MLYEWNVAKLKFTNEMGTVLRRDVIRSISYEVLIATGNTGFKVSHTIVVFVFPGDAGR